jgi:catalase
MRVRNVSDPVYEPNSYGGPKADPSRGAEAGLCGSDRGMARAACTLREDDDDYGQAAAMVRDVLDDDARARLVANVAGHLLGWGVRAGAAARARILEKHRRETR